MNRKAIPGRASLSFAATEGFLDIDQILETDPWTQIDDFVQRNFVQNILDQFNQLMTVDPGRSPTDYKTERGRRPTSSSENADNRLAVENWKKSTKGRENDAKAASNDALKQSRKETRRKSRDSNGKSINISKNEGKKLNSKKNCATNGRETASDKKEKKKGSSTVKRDAKVTVTPVAKSSRNQEKHKNTDLNCIKLSSEKEEVQTVQKKEVAKEEEKHIENSEIDSAYPTPFAMENSTANVAIKRRTQSIETRKRYNNSNSSFKTSTPNRTTPRIKTEHAVEKSSNCKLKKSQKHREAKDSENTKVDDRPVAKANIVNAKWQRERPNGKGNRVTRTPARVNNCTVEQKEEKFKEKATSKSCRNKTVKTEKYEKRLREKNERRLRRKMRRERRVQRAMEEFGHLVASIGKKMGYFPENGLSSSSENGSGRSCLDSRYSSSSDSSRSCNVSCSCSSSCSSCTCANYSSDSSYQYSEYTLCSCSGHDCSYTDDD